ncbi:hypothetical protein PGT21_016264 [Puccinia graminis f. sp. tritici]|uniref:Uncharacterized protein n=1 Tax=Puccinia graminis f. sp. tritici TaxID=56615 RepID=A0A5B0QUB3_PUCGR|nr:hypothetical protein PGT21_016264 [Puccinia graminis f. sp. tritici]
MLKLFCQSSSFTHLNALTQSLPPLPPLIKPTPPSTFVIPPTPVDPVSHNQRSAQTQPQPPKHLRSLAQLNQVALPLEEGDPKSDHFKVCWEYPTYLGDCPEGSPESRLTRKQRRNRNRNQTKEQQRLEDL